MVLYHFDLQVKSWYNILLLLKGRRGVLLRVQSTLIIRLCYSILLLIVKNARSIQFYLQLLITLLVLLLL